MRQKRSETLLKKVELNTESLISRLQNIIALSASTSSQEIQASEMLQIESNTMMMIRQVEELLSISRTLRENWILGQMPQLVNQDVNEEDFLHGISTKLDTALSKIINIEKFEEEIAHKEEIKEEENQDIEEKEELEEDQDHGKEIIGDEDLKKEDEEPKSGELVTKDVKQEENSMKKEHIEPEASENPIEIEEISNQTDHPKINNDSTFTNDMISLDTDLQPLTLGSDGNLEEIDFDNFGNLDDEVSNNDVIMLD